MSQILLKACAVIGLTLASCSMPFMEESDSSSFQVERTTPPHKGGLADSGDGFAKYFLNYDTNTPYDYRQGVIFDSLISSVRSNRKDFGASTQRPSTYAAPYTPQRSATAGLLKLGLNRDKNDPYQN